MISKAAVQCSCSNPHGDYDSLATCLWPEAEKVIGTGQYVVVASFLGRTQITLWTWIDDALDAKNTLDRAAAKDGFDASNRVHRLTLSEGEPNP